MAWKDRPVGLVYARCRAAQLRGPGAQVGSGWVLMLEEMPSSRHITCKPSEFPRQTVAFKRAPKVLNGEAPGSPSTITYTPPL
jgi:hypothetical protein